jgi:maleylacetate reductase
VRDGRDADGRELAQIGAWLAGATFAVTGSSIHHKLCHFLGGRYGLPHAEMHAALLPWVAEFVLPEVPSAGTAIGRALATADPVIGLRGLNGELGAPESLGALGLSVDQALVAADEIDLGGLAAPVTVNRDELRSLLSRATSGR